MYNKDVRIILNKVKELINKHAKNINYLEPVENKLKIKIKFKDYNIIKSTIEYYLNLPENYTMSYVIKNKENEVKACFLPFKVKCRGYDVEKDLFKIFDFLAEMDNEFLYWNGSFEKIEIINP